MVICLFVCLFFRILEFFFFLGGGGGLNLLEPNALFG